jgi:hypothetical protein
MSINWGRGEPVAINSKDLSQNISNTIVSYTEHSEWVMLWILNITSNCDGDSRLMGRFALATYWCFKRL